MCLHDGPAHEAAQETGGGWAEIGGWGGLERAPFHCGQLLKQEADSDSGYRRETLEFMDNFSLILILA